MPDSKISDLTSYTSPAPADVLPILDVTNNLVKKVRFSDLVYKGFTVSVAPQGSATKADFYTTGVADDVQVQKAVDLANSLGGGIVLMREGTYIFATPVICKSNVKVMGMGVATIIKTSTNTNAFASATAPLNDVEFEGLCFMGSVSATPSTPTRARATSGAGITQSILIQGSLDPHAPTQPLITNVVITHCYFRNNSSLPILISGISGRVETTNCEFTNNMDVGFKFNEEVIFNDNHVKMSADNGVSLSRGNKKITCVGNTFDNICYNGIWLAGFIGDKAPDYFNCVGNTIMNVGYSGIKVTDAPKFGVIAGNSINCGYFRGPADQPNDIECLGINIAGFGTAPSFSDFATYLVVTGNMIYQAARAGIKIQGAKGILLGHNLIADCGTANNAAGSSIATNDTTQNIGILFDSPTTLTDISIFSNSIIDERGSPHMNYSIYPNIVAGVVMKGNTSSGAINGNTIISSEFGGRITPRTAINDSDYTVLQSDQRIVETALSNGRTITLPTAVGVTGQGYLIKDEAGSAATHNITIATTSAQTIDGASTKTISLNYGSVRLYSNGANWLTE